MKNYFNGFENSGIKPKKPVERKEYTERKGLEYRHLSSKDRIKLQKQKNMFKNLKKVICFGSLISLLILLFGTGVITFYMVIENKNNFNAQGSGEILKQNDNLEGDLDLKNEKDDEQDKELEKFFQQNNFKNSTIKTEEENKVVKDTKLSKISDFSEWNKNCPKELVIVNGKNKIPQDYIVDIKVCRGKEIGILAWESLEKMIQDASKEGVILWISSGYRSVKYQEKLFNNQVERELCKGVSLEEATNLAQKVVAKPGMSEHNTGLAVDFNGVRDDFYKTKEYKWLMDNSAKYGFIERYQEKWIEKTGVIYEPWHFRYVGSYAQSIKESNLCLEDYVEQNFI